ncbi:hypothetical protein CDEF62S_04227 [Castellaniella defragrans]
MTLNADSSAGHSQDAGIPWWRQRWPWLLMLGPALAVAGCVITIVLAFQAYGDQAIADGGSQRGLVVAPPTASAAVSAAAPAAAASVTTVSAAPASAVAASAAPARQERP